MKAKSDAERLDELQSLISDADEQIETLEHIESLKATLSNTTAGTIDQARALRELSDARRAYKQQYEAPVDVVEASMKRIVGLVKAGKNVELHTVS